MRTQPLSVAPVVSAEPITAGFGQYLHKSMEANHNLRQWDQQPPPVPAAPASSSSFEGHAGNFSRSAWGDDAGGAFGLFTCPDPLASLDDPSWWSPPDDAFLDASPELADIDWTLDEELQQAITTAAATAALTTFTTHDLPLLAPAPQPTPMIPPADWSGFGMFDSNAPATVSTASSGTSRTRRLRRRPSPRTQRNKVAAQKYRQKKLDRIAELEVEVTDVKRERDELRIQLAKQEAETAALREMLRLASSGKMEAS
ncbi:hypothetical protein NLG97_g5181 [Lecanicillium saksenae]|uniref:Uncharacterized protein n=1 Tax=Lecanicillium saksenae TaxID=468837 RepID=A0ACC1QT81_9HYPO|nr:hypothetical protein NLG97_g5181 [Lecanicillium saksenae]